MLLTRSLPPQFLLPSWTGPELALAIQRSFLSSTSTRRLKIWKHASSKGTAYKGYGRVGSETEPPIERRGRIYARPSRSEPPTRVRHFKPPRPIPVPLKAFYVGKKYGELGSAEATSGAAIDTHEPDSLNRKDIADLRREMKREDVQKPASVRIRYTTRRIDPDGPALSIRRVDAKKIMQLSQKFSALRREAGYLSPSQKNHLRNGRKKVARLIEKATRDKRGRLTSEQVGHRRKLLAQKMVKGLPGKRLSLEMIEESAKDGREGWNSILSAVDKALNKDTGHETAIITIQRTDRRHDPEASKLSSDEHTARDSGMKRIGTSLKPLPWESKALPESLEAVKSLKPSRGQTSSVPKPTEHSKYGDPQPTAEELSLFEELFPEENRQRDDAVRRAEERLHKLPAFEWDLDERLDESWKTERERRKERLHTIPSRENVSAYLGETRWSPVAGAQETRVHKQNLEYNRRREPSVVVLSGVSKHLEESDFFRVGPKGNHIEGWTSGILKVVPARDYITLEPLGYYYLYFSSDAAARAYMDNTFRLHALGKNKGPSSTPFMPPPPGSLKEGENIKDLLRGFSVVPKHNKLSMTMLNKPYRPQILQLLENGGPPIMSPRASKDDALVLFSVDMAFVTYFDIVYAIQDDGRRRNMHWKFAGGKNQDITNISFNKEAQEKGQKGQKGSPHKYIFSMRDMQEARRFVREWHRRPLEVASKREHDVELGREKPAIVHAELLW